MEKMDTVKIVKDFYDKDAQYEWERLGKHRSEFQITKRFMNRYNQRGDTVLESRFMAALFIQ